MLETPQIIQTKAQPAAVIHITIPREQMKNVMGPGIGELMGAIAAQGLTIVGPIFARHLKLEPGVWDFELGIPVKGPVSAVGRVRPGELPAAKVARTVYQGAYDGLGAAWSEFMEWVTSNGHKPARGFWECYLSGPEADPDPATWRTELNRPLAG
jgi:effector-binding domain-containing protein